MAASNLRVPRAALGRIRTLNFTSPIARGDITYHGPGQVVCYPILNLDAIRHGNQGGTFNSLRGYDSRHRGVWCYGVSCGRTHRRLDRAANCDLRQEKRNRGHRRSHPSRWVTSHGFAYNVSTDLSYFDLIVPCGLVGCHATSLAKLLGRPVMIHEVLPRLAEEVGSQRAGPKMRALRKRIRRTARRQQPGGRSNQCVTVIS